MSLFHIQRRHARRFVSARQRVAWGLALAGIVAAGVSCAPAPTGAMGPRLELTPCQLTSPGSPVSLAAECGKLTVPEDRGAANGRNIDLRVAVVRAVSRAPWPDPLFFLTGGPGQAATESFVTIQAAFRRVRRDRDIVLVDQRGTGGSNPLRCPAGDESDVWLLDDEDIEPWVERCLDSLEGDPRFYTTSIAMRDLDDVRRALGHERINLYGVSYGTRAALTYLRLYPDRVRSIVLDGVVPPTETLGIDVARDAERALDLMMGRCSADPSCAKAFPEIGKAVDDVMARLDTPVPISLRHPRTGEIVSVELDRRMAAYAIRLLSYSQETVATIPLLLTSARENDLAPLAAQFLMTVGGVSETMSDAMGISIVCTEDYPFFEDDLIAERSRDTYLGAIQTDALKLVCPSWPRGEVPQGFRAPVKSSVPVLLLSGEADPVTPPENAEIVHSQLDRSLHIVAPGQGHVVIHRGCISSLASNFIEKGTFDGIDTSCVDRIAPRAFFTSFAGPLP